MNHDPADVLAHSTSHSPVCRPARMSSPSEWTPSDMARAQRTARAGHIECREKSVAGGVDLCALEIE